MSLHRPNRSALQRPPPAASPYRFGKYTLLAKLAQGGMGEVFAALLTGEAGFEKVVVIKRILPGLAEDPRFVSMFLTEARVTASLTHPNICQVFELGQIDGEYYLAMEYLEGVSLAGLIRRSVGRGLDVRVAAGVLCQALEGLQFAHCFRQPGHGIQGIIHRDMSPSNVFVTSAGLVKVLDFGVAKVSHHSVTTATGLKGKYPYMSPEQIRSQEVDGRADLFAVGVLLYEAVTGLSLFHRANDFETLFAVVEGPRPPASESRPDLPLGVEEVIDRALRVSREERFASAREMGEALARAVAPLGGPATIGQLADLVRRDCADEVEDERERIHNATSYLKALALRGQEPPAFINRRARAVVAESAEPRAAAEAAPDNGPTAEMPAPMGFVERTLTTASDRDAAALRHSVRGSRLNVIAIVVLAAAGSAGAAGWWLRGSEQEPVETAAASEAAAGAALASDIATPPAPSTARTASTATAAGPSTLPQATSEPEPLGSTRTGTPSDGADREPPKRQHSSRPARPGRSDKSTSTESAYLSVDAFPYAHIYIDGEPAGITPLVRIPVKPGRHTVRAVAESGAEDQFAIGLRPGETASRRLRLELLRP